MEDKQGKCESEHAEFSCFMVAKLYFWFLKGCYNTNKKYGLGADFVNEILSQVLKTQKESS